MVEYVYDAWGNHAVLSANGTDLTDAAHIGNRNPFRYRGYFYDVETGLYYLQTRYYDPEIGRFVTIDDLSYADPEIIHGLNLYAYCGNNPVMYTDPTGTAKWWEWLLGAVVCVALVASAVALTVFSGGSAVAAMAPMAGLAIKCAASVLTGAAASVLSYSTQLSQKDMDWASFGFDIGIGALSGFFSFGIGQGLNSVGQFSGVYLSQIKIANTVLTKIVPMETFKQIGGLFAEIIGGFTIGVYMDDQLNKLFNRPSNKSLRQRLVDSMQSDILSRFLDFIRYMWN